MLSIPTLRPLGETVGTEVRGISLATALDAPTIAWIQQAFAQRLRRCTADRAVPPATGFTVATRGPPTSNTKKNGGQRLRVIP